MSARVPRLAVFGFVAILATAGLTYAASQKIGASAPSTPAAPLVQQRAVLTVPDVRNEAFVFAKGALQDAGFAWRVTGRVHGYPSNTVVSQTPAAGTRVYDTGAPVVILTLVRNTRYPQQGTPEDLSPYRATATQYADAAAQPLTPPVTSTSPTGPATTAPATTTPAPTTPATTTPATTAPAATTPAPATTTPAPAADRAPAAKPAAVPAAKPAAAPAAAPAAPPAAAPAAAPAPAAPAAPAAKPAAARYPQSRPPAFLVAGAPKEPLDEMPLADRARALDRWLSAHPKPTDAVVKHWLYQNAWIVTGSRFGWWHGAEALTILIRVDRRAESLWGIGGKSEAVARGALAEVEARSR